MFTVNIDIIKRVVCFPIIRALLAALRSSSSGDPRRQILWEDVLTGKLVSESEIRKLTVIGYSLDIPIAVVHTPSITSDVAVSRSQIPQSIGDEMIICLRIHTTAVNCYLAADRKIIDLIRVIISKS